MHIYLIVTSYTQLAYSWLNESIPTCMRIRMLAMLILQAILNIHIKTKEIKAKVLCIVLWDAVWLHIYCFQCITILVLILLSPLQLVIHIQHSNE